MQLPFADARVRRRRLPVRRDVLPRQGAGVRRSAARAAAGRPLHVQRLGPDRGERIRRRRDDRARARCSRTIRRASWRARRTATTTARRSRAISRPAASPHAPRIDDRRRAQPRGVGARIPAIAYCQGTPLRNEIEARDAAGARARRPRPAAAAIAERFGSGPVDGKIQAHVVEVGR